ncbi:MAG: hypothetical protein RL174_409 [Actinomycetota bacterium]
MGFLDNFEKGLERFVTSAFSKTFKSELQPIEIAAAIRSEMDSKASIISRDRILAPNSFKVSLSSADFSRMATLGMPLISELTELTTRHAQKQGFQFGAALSIKLIEDGTLNLGQISVSSSSQELAVEWTPTLEVGGRRFSITKARTTVGRDATADIQINDPGLSRQHFEIVWDGKSAGVRDLGSTNGTKVSGQTISSAAIGTDTVINAGQSEFIFRVIANAVDSDVVSPGTNAANAGGDLF